MNTWSGIYKADFLNKYKIRHNETPGASYQDNGFWFQTFIYAKRAMFLNKIFYLNRRDNPNSSVKNPAKVFCMKEEYDYIRSLLAKDAKLLNKFLGIYHYKKCENYLFTFRRVDIKFKKMFLKVFNREFKEAYKKGEIDETLFRTRPSMLDELHMVVKKPMKFYRNKLNRLSLFEKIFSIKNQDIHKVVRFFGLKLKIKSRKLIEMKKLNNIELSLKRMNKKLVSIQDCVSQYRNEMFCLFQKNDIQIRDVVQNFEEELELKNQEVTRELELLKNKIMPIYNSYNIKHINKEKISSEMENFDVYGINTEPRSSKIIVSLTSYPDRMYDLHYSIYSLLKQSLKPDAVILYLTKSQFPNGEKDIPQKILNMKNYGLTIKWYENNIKSYTKLIPALIDFPDDIIVTADDDIYYSVDWLKNLYEEYLQSDKSTIIANRCHKITFSQDGKVLPYRKWNSCVEDASMDFKNFLTGVGGVLYPPNSLYKDVIREDIFQKLCPNADDVWFWSMAVLNNTRIKVPVNPYNLVYVNIEREVGLNGERTLSSKNCGLNENDLQLSVLLDYYPDILNILKNNSQEIILTKQN